MTGRGPDDWSGMAIPVLTSYPLKSYVRTLRLTALARHERRSAGSRRMRQAPLQVLSVNGECVGGHVQTHCGKLCLINRRVRLPEKRKAGGSTPHLTTGSAVCRSSLNRANAGQGFALSDPASGCKCP